MSVTVRPTITCDGCGEGRNSLFRCYPDNLATALAEFRAYLAQPRRDLVKGSLADVEAGWRFDGGDWCPACAPAHAQPTIDLGGAA